MIEYCRGGCGELLNHITMQTVDKLCQTCTDAVMSWGVIHRNLSNPFDWVEPQRAKAEFWAALGVKRHGMECYNHPAWLVLVDEWLAAGASKELVPWR